MDEEEKMNAEQNGEQSTGEKINEEIQDTTKMAKDAASLGTNVATGNVGGVIKDSLKLLTNKRFWRQLLIQALTPIIIIILVASMLLGIFNAIGEGVSDIVEGIIEFFTLDDGGAIVVSDEQVDMIINTITDLGIDMDGLKLMGDVDYSNPDIQAENQEALREYIREFYEAQAMTQTLNTNPNWLEELASGGKPYGTVYVHRATQDEVTPTDENQLTYIKYEKMLEMQQAGDKNIVKYFSMDEERKLVIAGWVQTIIKVDGKQISDETIIELQHIDYKNAVSQYTTSMNFLLYLTMISQNPEFVSAVTDLVKQSDIRITLMDKDTTSVSTETKEHIKHTKTVRDVSGPNETEPDYETTETSEKVTTVTEITTIGKKPMVAITYAKTWFSEQTVTYNKVKEGPDTIVGEVIDGGADDPEPSISGEGTVTWITGRTVQVDTTTTIEEYVEGTRGDVIDRTGKKGDPGIIDSNGNGKVDGNEKVDENTTFMGLLDDKFKIPNSTRYDSAAGNVVSGAEMFFYLLKKDPSAQNLEIWMRYILNKYTETNRYGDISFSDISKEYEIRMLTTGSNYIVNTAMSAPNLCITDAGVLRDAISKTYSGKVKENLTKEVNNFIKMQEEHHVNAVFAIAVTMVESTAGTNWDLIDSSTYNWYSITGSYNGKSYIDRNSTEWRKYPSFREATFDFGDLIENSEHYFKAGKYTVEEIAPVYCSEEWGTAVISVMNEIYAAAGIEIPIEGFVVGGITTDEQAQELQEYIENNLIHTKEHTSGEYQKGPFAKWWTYAYNNLEPFQCTWWVYGRASMYLEQSGSKYTKYPIAEDGKVGNGGKWYEKNQQNGWFKYGSTPKPNSIISWTNGSYGHVAYVEGVSEDGIYISHAGYGKAWYGVDKIPLDGSFSGYKLNGYIYLDEPK